VRNNESVTERHYLTTSELALELGLHEITLIRWRTSNRGPRFHRLSRRAVHYARADVNAWLEENGSVLAAA
jgi:predicted DNA-binding transcriptional regulator AlpA